MGLKDLGYVNVFDSSDRPRDYSEVICFLMTETSKECKIETAWYDEHNFWSDRTSNAWGIEGGLPDNRWKVIAWCYKDNINEFRN